MEFIFGILLGALIVAILAGVWFVWMVDKMLNLPFLAGIVLFGIFSK